LSAALNSDPDGVGKLFSAGGDSSDALVSYKRSTVSTKEGDYAINITQAATQGFHTGAVASALTIDANNDTFGVKINGVQSGSIALTQKTYASNNDLAMEIQDRINGDSALKAKGINVAVAYDTDHFVITSSAYGSGSKVEFTSVDTNTAADLGFSVGNGTDGKDVAGTIGGQEATGFGQLLTGATGNSVGLQVEVRGSATGSRGNVTFSRGIADQLNTTISGFLDSTTGSISNRTDEINTGIKNIGSQRTATNDRLAALQKRYLTQFNAMDAIVASLKSTGDYLTQQFSSMMSN
jgi:flagellar hook-associated protein 2